MDWKLAWDAREDIECLGSEGVDSVIDGLAVALPAVLKGSSSCSTLSAGVHLPLSVPTDNRGGGGESAPWIPPSHDTFLLIRPRTALIGDASPDVRASTCKTVSSEKRDWSPWDGREFSGNELAKLAVSTFRVGTCCATGTGRIGKGSGTGRAGERSEAIVFEGAGLRSLPLVGSREGRGGGGKAGVVGL